MAAVSELQKYLIDQFIELLDEHAVRFVYQKLDGSRREAFGTRDLGLVPAEHQPNGKGSWEKPDYLRYYDFGKGGWRCLILTRLLSIEVMTVV